MMKSKLIAISLAFLAGCSGSGAAPDCDLAPTRAPIAPERVERAVAQLDTLAATLMARHRIPGMSVAVVHGGRTVYAKGFGVREAGRPEAVDADTVFALASVSKSVGATVVARQVGLGRVSWDTPVRVHLPWFALKDSLASARVTIGDLYAHRSGLPDHAGDLLEALGDDRITILQRLALMPLGAFREQYAYTNYGMTAAGHAVALAAGTDWATLSHDSLYQPLGMTRTSSRVAEFEARTNRAPRHVPKGDGSFELAPPYDTDGQSPAGGASSSARDMARWMALVLAGGTLDGHAWIAPQALREALSPQVVSAPPQEPGAPTGYYGYGFNVSSSPACRRVLSHSGAFLLGTATAFTLIPSADTGIVVLTNAPPVGVPEALAAQFADLVQFGTIQRDWPAVYEGAFAPITAPTGRLLSEPRPAPVVPSENLTAYAGVYQNDFYGPLQVNVVGGALELRLGPRNLVLPLTHWSGDVFAHTFDQPGEAAQVGSISAVEFTPDSVTIEFLDEEKLGTFVR